MKDLICDEFQNVVGELLIRHHSILDILSKLNEASSKVNRAVIKTVTDCGCMKIAAEKIQVPEDVDTYADLRAFLDNHLRGELCEHCDEIVVGELGKLLFYTAALCNALDINMYDVFIKEYKKASALGVFNMT